ncbi:MAG: arsenate reductase (glutaredoxin) [Rhizobium sp.]|nr:arsenate reductase (glutaredoxin) [Rhizobium sp.]
MAWLAARGLQAEVMDYLGQPPTAAAVLALLGKLGGDPRALVRFKEDEAKALGLAVTDERPTTEWAALLAAHPRLIERPVLEVGERAVIGRPVERFEQLL